jgi:hypothetical protein
VVLDVNMPVLDGLSAAKQIKKKFSECADHDPFDTQRPGNDPGLTTSKGQWGYYQERFRQRAVKGCGGGAAEWKLFF